MAPASRLRVVGLGLAAALALGAPAAAQIIGAPQSITVIDSGTACVTAPTACATYILDNSTGGLTLSVAGTWTGTLTFEGTNNDGNWTSLLVTNLATAAQATTTTANGLFTVTNAGVIKVRLRATAAITGTATITAAKGLGFARAGPSTVSLGGLASTSTDGMSVVNPTLATAGATVQMSPRFKWCGAAYNSVSTLSETDCWFAENLPATVAGTTTATWKLGVTINGGAATYPFVLTSAGNGTFTGAVTGQTISGTSNIGSGGVFFGSSSGAQLNLNAQDGTAIVQNGAQTIGVRLKADALPGVSSCGAGSPAVVAGSTPLSGAVTIGTTSVVTCTITFNGTAFPSAPHCSGAVETTTAANVRAMGFSATTTVLTIVPTAAWADSSVVNWHCFSSK